MIDRDALGRIVREAWIRWAGTQPDAKISWLVPYDFIPEREKEADRQIGEAVARALEAELAAALERVAELEAWKEEAESSGRGD